MIIKILKSSLQYLIFTDSKKIYKTLLYNITIFKKYFPKLSNFKLKLAYMVFKIDNRVYKFFTKILKANCFNVYFLVVNS